MYRKALAIPAAAVFLLSGGAGIGRWNSAAHARVAADSFSGTISVSDYQVPNALGAGGLAASQANFDLANMMTDSLLGIDNKGKFYADAVTDVPSTSNGGLKVVNGNEIITYHLKPDQKWSDGSPVTQADWISELVINYSPEVSSYLGTAFDQIQTASFSGNDLVVTFKGVLGSALQQTDISPQPWEYMQKKYSAAVSGLDMSSFNRAKEIDAKTGVITAALDSSSGLKKFATAYNADNYNSPSDLFNGPYKLQTWSADQRYVLVANPNYNLLPADANHPRPAKIQQIVLSEEGATYIQDLKAGSTYQTIDSATDFSPDNISDLRQTKYQVSVIPGLVYELLDLMVGPTFNGHPNPLADIRVRQALNYSIDKFAYLKALYPAFDPKQLATASLLPSSNSWSINSQLPANAYDPAKAMALLKAAGYATTLGTGGNHLNLDFVTTKKVSRIKGAQIFQRFFNQVGIGIRIRYANATGQNGLFSAWADGGIQYHHTFQISLHGYGTNPDPDESSLNSLPNQISSASNPAGNNVDAVNDPKLTALWLAGRNTLDDAQRHKIYDQVQQYFYQQAYNISLFTAPEITLYKGTIGNAKANFTQGGPWWNSFEWFYDASNSQKAS